MTPEAVARCTPPSQSRSSASTRGPRRPHTKSVALRPAPSLTAEASSRPPPERRATNIHAITTCRRSTAAGLRHKQTPGRSNRRKIEPPTRVQRPGLVDLDKAGERHVVVGRHSHRLLDGSVPHATSPNRRSARFVVRGVETPTRAAEQRSGGVSADASSTVQDSSSSQGGTRNRRPHQGQGPSSSPQRHIRLASARRSWNTRTAAINRRGAPQPKELPRGWISAREKSRRCRPPTSLDRRLHHRSADAAIRRLAIRSAAPQVTT